MIFLYVTDEFRSFCFFILYISILIITYQSIYQSIYYHNNDNNIQKIDLFILTTSIKNRFRQQQFFVNINIKINVKIRELIRSFTFFFVNIRCRLMQLQFSLLISLQFTFTHSILKICSFNCFRQSIDFIQFVETIYCFIRLF